MKKYGRSGDIDPPLLSCAIDGDEYTASCLVVVRVIGLPFVRFLLCPYNDFKKVHLI
jgi:hypothetical protein